MIKPRVLFTARMCYGLNYSPGPVFSECYLSHGLVALELSGLLRGLTLKEVKFCSSMSVSRNCGKGHNIHSPCQGMRAPLTLLPFHYRSRSLALNTMLTNSVRAEDGEAGERAGIQVSISLSEIDPLSLGMGKLPLKIDTHGSQLRNSSASRPSIVYIEPENMPETVRGNIQEDIPETTSSPVEYQDKLYLHLKENLGKVKAYAVEIARKVPVPDQCDIEGKCFEVPTLAEFQMSETKLSRHLNIHTLLWTFFK